MAFDRLSQQTTRIERRSVCRRNDADLTLRYERHLSDGNAEEVRMNRPESRRQRAKLNAFDAAAFDEGNRVLKIVVRVLRAVRRKVSASGQRLAVNSFYDAKLVRAYLNQRDFPHDLLKRPLD